MTRMLSDREAVIEQIGLEIYELRDSRQKIGETLADEEIHKMNAEGWTVELRLPSEAAAGGYHDDRSYTRIAGVVLSIAEISQALERARGFAAA